MENILVERKVYRIYICICICIITHYIPYTLNFARSKAAQLNQNNTGQIVLAFSAYFNMDHGHSIFCDYRKIVWLKLKSDVIMKEVEKLVLRVLSDTSGRIE